MRKLLMVVALAMLLLSCIGCKSHYYHPRFPVLENPARPDLVNIPGSEMKKMSPEARKAVASNFNELIDYSRKLEKAIDTYNTHAVKQNEILDNISKEK